MSHSCFLPILIVAAHRLWAPADIYIKIYHCALSIAHFDKMSASNSKLLEFFARIPKLESDGSNWVIFKDRFLFATAAASLKAHVDGTGKPPVAVPVIQAGSKPLSEEQSRAFSEYDASLLKWETEEAIVKQL